MEKRIVYFIRDLQKNAAVLNFAITTMHGTHLTEAQIFSALKDNHSKLPLRFQIGLQHREFDGRVTFIKTDIKWLDTKYNIGQVVPFDKKPFLNDPKFSIIEKYNQLIELSDETTYVLIEKNKVLTPDLKQVYPSKNLIQFIKIHQKLK